MCMSVMAAVCLSGSMSLSGLSLILLIPELRRLDRKFEDETRPEEREESKGTMFDMAKRRPEVREDVSEVEVEAAKRGWGSLNLYLVCSFS